MNSVRKKTRLAEHISVHWEDEAEEGELEHTLATALGQLETLMIGYARAGVTPRPGAPSEEPHPRRHDALC